jgi:hypothetical protein
MNEDMNEDMNEVMNEDMNEGTQYEPVISRIQLEANLYVHFKLFSKTKKYCDKKYLHFNYN